MEHLPQHHQQDSSEVTSFSFALSLLPPAMCQRSQGHEPELQTPAPYSPGACGHDVLGQPPALAALPSPCIPDTGGTRLPCPAPRGPAVAGGDTRGDAPSPCWGANEPAQSQGNENLPGHNANSLPINSPQSLCSLALSSSATSPRSPSSSSQANGLFGHGDSSIGTLGCAWEPLNGSAAVSEGRSDRRHPWHPSDTLPAPMGDGAAPRSGAHCQTLTCSCRFNVRLRTLTFTA